LHLVWKGGTGKEGGKDTPQARRFLREASIGETLVAERPNFSQILQRAGVHGSYEAVA
jgi:hypothetical protein